MNQICTNIRQKTQSGRANCTYTHTYKINNEASVSPSPTQPTTACIIHTRAPKHNCSLVFSPSPLSSSRWMTYCLELHDLAGAAAIIFHQTRRENPSLHSLYPPYSRTFLFKPRTLLYYSGLMYHASTISREILAMRWQAPPSLYVGLRDGADNASLAAPFFFVIYRLLWPNRVAFLRFFGEGKCLIEKDWDFCGAVLLWEGEFFFFFFSIHL